MKLGINIIPLRPGPKFFPLNYHMEIQNSEAKTALISLTLDPEMI
jgi:hypothetical protein